MPWPDTVVVYRCLLRTLACRDSDNCSGRVGLEAGSRRAAEPSSAPSCRRQPSSARAVPCPERTASLVPPPHRTLADSRCRPPGQRSASRCCPGGRGEGPAQPAEMLDLATLFAATGLQEELAEGQKKHPVITDAEASTSFVEEAAEQISAAFESVE
ncbi:unnamed protein product, partial [Prorocentrum cordatum]